MKFNVHNGVYPFPVVPGVQIEAENAEDALAAALLMHATEQNPHPVVSEATDGHNGSH